VLQQSTVQVLELYFLIICLEDCFRWNYTESQFTDYPI